MNTSLLHELDLLDCVIIQRQSNDEFEVLYNHGDWLTYILPESKQQKTFKIGSHSLYLEDFLIDAEQLWASSHNARIESGIWSEEEANQTFRLEASAVVKNTKHYLVINRLGAYFQKKQQTLQTARELLITNDQITEQHELLHQQINELMRLDIERSQTLQPPIIEALEQTDLGVAILDANLQLITGNPSLQALFVNSHIEISSPIDRLILDLFKRQYPEHNRIIDTASTWTGEICWLNPPEQGKWLKLSMQPIKNLAQKVQFWIISVSDVTQIKFLLNHNEKLTHYDVLTDLPNRQYFWQQLESKIKKCKPFYLLYLDLKNFKKINDLHGHIFGDDVIKEMSKRLRSVAPIDDLVARIGGTEFAIIFALDQFHNQFSPSEHTQCITFVKELIRVSSVPFYLESGNKCEVGLSIGAAAFPKDTNSAEELMKYADLAVFSAKKKKQSGIEFYSKELVEASLKRLEMEESLQKSLTNNDFELHFQPILDLKSAQIVKAEALIRWRLNDDNLISPDHFIPLAEQTGLIIPIGKWVITEACKTLALLQKNQISIKLSINLSPRQINDRQLFSFIKNTLQQYNIDPALLEFELTESVLIDNYDKVQLLLTELRALGISISIDDFGTGYSSLSYIQKLPIDHIKIDKSFIMALTGNLIDTNGNGAIVKAVIAMANSLKLGVIAEGVETKMQKQFLLQNNCHIVQGYLFSRPLPFAEFQQLLSSSQINF